MPHDVIMPALGMAQDNGLIVSWLKQPGDAVRKGDALFEVETDKATMEVEAQDEGFLSSVIAPAGSDVPVGQVIAKIVGSAGEVDRDAVAAAAPAPAAPAAGTPKSAPDAASPPSAAAAAPRAPTFSGPAPAPAPVASSVGASARILASPKAKRLAAERGLDLGRLAAAGVPQPYHVADLDRVPTVAGFARSTLNARASAVALDALLAKAAPDTDRAALFVAFARGAWRAVFGDAPLAVTILRLDGTRDGGGDGAPLALADLTATRLTGFAGKGPGLSLSVARDGPAIALTLSFAESELPFASAAQWLDELAARIEDPVRQLV
jgi:pyruvate/2-oxoglutarate dehydrogenase complex dihydrolipoamide acyltransferase (E2) component